MISAELYYASHVTDVAWHSIRWPTLFRYHSSNADPAVPAQHAASAGSSIRFPHLHMCCHLLLDACSGARGAVVLAVASVLWVCDKEE